jgi:purine-cytosine permease-like protein
MRKYLFSGAVIGAALSGIAIVRATIVGPRDWRLLLTWVAWAASLAIAIGTVSEETKQSEPGR